MSRTRGIVYVATKKESYIAEACVSATSAKQYASEFESTLFTNLVDSNYAKSPSFDSVVPISTTMKYTSEWAQGQLDRIQCLNDSPYEETLHLDTDTKIKSPEFKRVFDPLVDHDIAMIECAVDNSISRAHYGRPMFNVGFILYRKNEKTKKLFEAWAELTKRHFEIASTDPMTPLSYLEHIQDPQMRRNLLFMDQLSFVQLLSPEVNVFDLRLKILHEKWNFRGAANGRMPEHEIIVDHRPNVKQTNLNHRSAPPPAVTPFNMEDGLRKAEALLSESKIEDAIPIVKILLSSPIETLAQLMRIGVCCHQANLESEAEQCFRKIIAKQPENITAFTNLSIVTRHLGKFHESIAAAKRALEMDAKNRMASICLATAYLRAEMPAEALEQCDRHMAMHPDHTGFLGLRIVALGKLNFRAEANYYQDFDRLVKKFDCFDAESDREDFNRGLSESVAKHPSLRQDVFHHSTRNGWHSGGLSQNDGPEYGRMLQMIEKNLTSYLADVFIPQHPLLLNRPSRRRTSFFWAVIMRRQGHQLSHTHPSGWLSGVYYAKVPKTIGKDLSNPHGWIEFGMPPPEHYGPSPHLESRMLQPELGKMILFPSYYWHRTVPLETDETRISFAFDIVRA